MNIKGHFNFSRDGKLSSSVRRERGRLWQGSFFSLLFIVDLAAVLKRRNGEYEFFFKLSCTEIF